MKQYNTCSRLSIVICHYNQNINNNNIVYSLDANDIDKQMNSAMSTIGRHCVFQLKTLRCSFVYQNQNIVVRYGALSRHNNGLVVFDIFLYPLIII